MGAWCWLLSSDSWDAGGRYRRADIHIWRAHNLWQQPDQQTLPGCCPGGLPPKPSHPQTHPPTLSPDSGWMARGSITSAGM